MSAHGFQFKQFYVAHDKCAMKVGTDGVLLGAWAPIQTNTVDTIHVLDIGTGSGILALMLAQRLHDKNFVIEAIDIEPNAIEQAKENMKKSPWRDNINPQQISLQDFVTQTNTNYQIIVSNPPYFQNSLKNLDKAKELARHTDSLSYKDLLTMGKYLLANNGIFSIIIPIESANSIYNLAAHIDLYIKQQTIVHTTPKKEGRRILIAFTKYPTKMQENHLILEATDKSRSDEYIQLTKDFYL